jgi:hypothetical protein
MTFFPYQPLIPLASVVIPGGSYSDCAYVSGIVFRKTGTNKQMPKEIINPRIMVRVRELTGDCFC